MSKWIVEVRYVGNPYNLNCRMATPYARLAASAGLFPTSYSLPRDWYEREMPDALARLVPQPDDFTHEYYNAPSLAAARRFLGTLRLEGVLPEDHGNGCAARLLERLP